MIKSNRSLKRRSESNKNAIIDSDVIPWIVLVIIAFLVMIMIIKLSATTDTIKQLVH